MTTKIVTYTSSMKTSSTIFIDNVLLQNTQIKLSYIHVQFIDNLQSTGLDQFSDILALDGTYIPVHSIEQISTKYHKSIVWSKNIIEAVVSFINHTKDTLTTSYIIIHTDQGIDIKQRSHNPIHNKPPFINTCKPQSLHTFDSSQYLYSRFTNLHKHKKKPIETIFNRLNKANQNRNNTLKH
ncbi:hypothetical protein M896_051920 [Ordospora colligata OC4]|uniref:Uncharacterized protein n=1 Tax=Ordospora colligata OC4 TaxID=1354746 RepID=A0A0B2UKE1_9MICR|nr:uncharacterized protein M896_051920 [Ordospora colligata OC4]KHN69783.1 hypothetical protein M896_051920 [Ordospora colligata OC4]